MQQWIRWWTLIEGNAGVGDENKWAATITIWVCCSNWLSKNNKHISRVCSILLLPPSSSALLRNFVLGFVSGAHVTMTSNNTKFCYQLIRFGLSQPVSSSFYFCTNSNTRPDSLDWIIFFLGYVGLREFIFSFLRTEIFPKISFFSPTRFSMLSWVSFVNTHLIFD